MLPGDLMLEENETINLVLGVNIVRCQSCGEAVEIEGDEDLANTACPNCSCFLVMESCHGTETIL